MEQGEEKWSYLQNLQRKEGAEVHFFDLNLAAKYLNPGATWFRVLDYRLSARN